MTSLNLWFISRKVREVIEMIKQFSKLWQDKVFSFLRDDKLEWMSWTREETADVKSDSGSYNC